ncbi:apolipoprotein L3-like [Acipenser ruthenus]|uniref:apolipoprotein L3-like n=1 Tax=Acipenser ruthenus TaxID=7906 RepID=UPI0027406151|nr:apolipoprotein L3-like [Acipenser ruthenus]
MGQQAEKSKLQGTDMDRTSGGGRNSTEYECTKTSKELLESEDSSTEAEDLSSEIIEQFIQLFSEKKPEIERHLKHLHEIADGLDEVNRNSAIAKTTGSCVSAAGGVMTIAGFALAPFTFGASTLLAGVGLGVGLLGGATTVGTEITKAVIDGGENKKVAEILEDVESAMSELDKSVGKACQTVSKWDETGFEHILKATGQLGAKGASAASALSRVVRVSLSKGARIAGGVVAGVFVALDVYEIAKNSIDIHKGCKSERAKEIRKLVETTEADLAELEDVCSDMKKLSDLREADLDRTVRRRRHSSECDLTDLTEELEEPQGSSLTVELDPEKKRTMEKETSELPAIAEAAFPVRITAKAGAALGLSALAALAVLSTEDPIAVGAIVLMLLLLVLMLCLTVQLSRQIQ